MSKWVQVLWPSFLVAGLAEIVFFTLVDPQQFYLLGEPVNYPESTTYSIGFFAFWLICAASSFMTLFFQRSSRELNAPH